MFFNLVVLASVVALLWLVAWAIAWYSGWLILVEVDRISAELEASVDRTLSAEQQDES